MLPNSLSNDIPVEHRDALLKALDCARQLSSYAASLPSNLFAEQWHHEILEATSSKHCTTCENPNIAASQILASINAGPNDQIIVPAICNQPIMSAIEKSGATPIQADVSSDSLLIDPSDVVRRVSTTTKAVIASDFNGQPCNYPRLQQICNANGLKLVSFSENGPGGISFGRNVSEWVDIACTCIPNSNGRHVQPLTVITTDDQMVHERLSQAIETVLSLEARTGPAWSLAIASLRLHVESGISIKALAESGLQCLRQIPYLTAIPDSTKLATVGHSFAFLWDASRSGITRDCLITHLKQVGFQCKPMKSPSSFSPETSSISQRLIQIVLEPETTKSKLDMLVASINQLCIQSENRIPVQVEHKGRAA